MLKILTRYFEPYIICLVGTVVLASILPAQGIWADGLGIVVKAAIVALFFMHGAKLPASSVLAGIRNWRLHLAILAATFLLFPALGLAISASHVLPAQLAAGFIFLAVLPSTVQSSIAFTSIARGNVAAAIFAASFSNLAGIFVTPALVALFLHGNAGHSAQAVEAIVFQLLLPFLAGQAARPLIGRFVDRHKKVIGLVDRGSILLVVYSAFGAAVLDGLWSHVSILDLLLILCLSLGLLFVVLCATWFGGALLGFSAEDRKVLLFCGSKKSLASGVPMAGVLFAPAQFGTIILPLMFFHQVQLIACAVIAGRLARKGDMIEAEKAGAEKEAMSSPVG